jgi:hypothetical protein
MLKILMGGDLTAQWRCELHVLQMQLSGGQKQNVARHNGGACLEFLLQVAKMRATRTPQHRDCKWCALRRRVHRAVVTLTPVKKARHSLRPFSRNSHIVIGNKCRYAVPHLAQTAQ